MIEALYLFFYFFFNQLFISFKVLTQVQTHKDDVFFSLSFERNHMSKQQARGIGSVCVFASLLSLI